MYNLITALKEVDDQKLLDVPDVYSMLEFSVKQHLTGTHITRTWPCGSSGRLEAVWHESERRFVDPGNNTWLRYYQGKWTVSVRHDTSDVVVAMVAQANAHADRGRLNQMWQIYWMLILMDHTQYDIQAEEVRFDIHFEPFVQSDYLSPAEMGMD